MYPNKTRATPSHVSDVLNKEIINKNKVHQVMYRTRTLASVRCLCDTCQTLLSQLKGSVRDPLRQIPAPNTLTQEDVTEEIEWKMEEELNALEYHEVSASLDSC